MHTPDTSLHEQWCRHRDADALAELVRRHSSMVYSTCMRVLRNASAAEEAAQECFIELFKVTSPIRPSVGGWLHIVAARRALDHLKMELRRKTREADYAIHAPKSITPHWDDVSAHIDDAIASLDEETRLPVVLRFLDGKSQPEIARELGVSVATVKRRVSQGVHRIREDLRGKGISVTAIALAAMLEEVPALPLPNAAVAELGKLGISGSAAWNGTTGTAAVKSAATIGGLIAVKKIVVAAMIAIVGLVLVQQQYFDSTPAAPPSSPEIEAARSPAPEFIHAAVTEAPPETTLATDAGPSITGVVLDHQDKPVEGATVVMWRLPKGDARVETSSAADGSFTFREFASTKRAGLKAKKDGMVWLSTPDAIHELTESGLSGLVVRLYPEAIAEGRVLDPSGRPVVDKEVSARYHDPGGALTIETVNTNSAGQFRISNLLPGTHSVSVIPGEQFRIAMTDAELTLKPGETRLGIEIVYAGDDLVVAGRVVDEKGGPIPGAFVQMMRVDGSDNADAYSDQEGRFRLVRIPEGQYELAVTHQDYTMALETATGGDESMQIVLSPVARAGLSGRVVAAETGDPIVKFDIQVSNSVVKELHESGFGFFRSKEHENGEFSWEEVMQGQVTVIARAPGREMKYEHVDLTQGPPAELTIRLESSAIAKGVVVTNSGAPVPSAHMLLSPFPHSLVARMPEGDALWLDWLERNKVARSKEDGTFEIDSLIPELRVITAYHPDHGFGSVAVSKATVANKSLRIVLSEGGAIEGTVTIGGEPFKGAGVSIVSRGPFGENAVGGAATDERGTYHMTGVPAGTWTVAVTVPSGRAPTPMDFLNGRRIDRNGVVVADGQVTLVDFEVPAAGASVEGTVLLDGEPVDEGQVIVLIEGAQPDSDQAELAGDGSYRIENLPDGLVRIIARGGLDEVNQRSKTLSVILEAGQTHEAEIELAGGVALQGTVRGLRPEENHVQIRAFKGVVKQSELHPFQEMRQVIARTMADPGGTYSIEGLTSGTYTLIINASVLDENGVFISGRDSQAIIEVDGTDGDVMQLDPEIE